MSTAARQKTLQEQYFFTCFCDACESATNRSTADNCHDWSKAYRCPHCSGSSKLLGSGQQKCDKCQEDINDQALRQVSAICTNIDNIVEMIFVIFNLKMDLESLNLWHFCWAWTLVQKRDYILTFPCVGVYVCVANLSRKIKYMLHQVLNFSPALRQNFFSLSTATCTCILWFTPLCEKTYCQPAVIIA